MSNTRCISDSPFSRFSKFLTPPSIVTEPGILSFIKLVKSSIPVKSSILLDETSREKLLERRSLETEYRQKELNQTENVDDLLNLI